MKVAELKDWVALGQDAVTIVAIVVAGVWAYYTFIVGRSSAAQVQIECGLKRMIATASGKILAISVTLRNTGRTRVDELSCDITVAPIPQDRSDRASLAFIDPPSDVCRRRDRRQPCASAIRGTAPWTVGAPGILGYLGMDFR